MRKIVGLQILERTGCGNTKKVVHTYNFPDVPVEFFDWPCETVKDFENYVNGLDIPEYEKKAHIDKAYIAVNVHFPKNFYRFTWSFWKY